MYILYTDESYKNKRYSLGAVFIVDSKIRKLKDDFEKFWKKIGFNPDIEFHAEKIWNAHGEFSSLKENMNKRAELCKNIAEWLADTTITRFYAGCIEMKESDGDSYVSVLEKIIDKAVNYVVKYAPKSSKQLLIIFDERKDIKGKIQKSIEEKYYEVIKRHKSACYILDYGYEGNSNHSRTLQIADFVGYFFSKYKNSNRENNLFNKKDDKRQLECIDYIYEKIKEKLEIVK